MFQGIQGAITLAILDYLYIFVVLSGLAIVMIMTAKIVHYQDASKNNVNTVKVSKTQNKAISEKKSVNQPKEVANDNFLKEKAVITTAIMAYLSEARQGPASHYRIINIKPVFNKTMSPWVLVDRKLTLPNKK